MTTAHHRLDAIRSVRRRDRAEAFGALKDAFEKVETLELELAQIRQQQSSIQAELNIPLTSGAVLAGRLHMDATNREKLLEELLNLKLVENKLAKRAERAKAALESARETASRAHKALIVLDEDPNR